MFTKNCINTKPWWFSLSSPLLSCLRTTSAEIYKIFIVLFLIVFILQIVMNGPYLFCIVVSFKWWQMSTCVPSHRQVTSWNGRNTKERQHWCWDDVLNMQGWQFYQLGNWIKNLLLCAKLLVMMPSPIGIWLLVRKWIKTFSCQKVSMPSLLSPIGILGYPIKILNQTIVFCRLVC